jgi:hypothetical protein
MKSNKNNSKPFIGKDTTLSLNCPMDMDLLTVNLEKLNTSKKRINNKTLRNLAKLKKKYAVANTVAIAQVLMFFE